MRTVLGRLPFGVWIALLVGAALVAGSVVLLSMPSGGVRYEAAARVDLPVPDESDPGSTESAPPASATAPADALPPSTDAALIEAGPFGSIPRIGPDGQRPLVAYATPFDHDDPRSMVSVMVLGLGLQADLVEAALALPSAVSLHFSPYAPDLPTLVERARRDGHEVLLDLPMEPQDYPVSDPGPHTLLAAGPAEVNLERLDWIMAQATGYLGFAGTAGRFGQSDQAVPVIDELAARGLGLIEIGDEHLASTAVAAGLPYVGGVLPIDEEPSALSIDYALAGLEAEALSRGHALAVALGYPVSLERLRVWAATLDDKDLRLAPASAVLNARIGLASGAGGDADGEDEPEG